MQRKEYLQAFIAHTNRNIFLTGKAGTGKTTLLHYIKEHTYKSCVIAAPTGIAALNATAVRPSTPSYSSLSAPSSPDSMAQLPSTPNQLLVTPRDSADTSICRSVRSASSEPSSCWSSTR